jgi:hypothetical protein
MKIRLAVLGVIATVVVVFAATFVPMAFADKLPVTICHRTGSDSSPYHAITPANAGVVAAHVGDPIGTGHVTKGLHDLPGRDSVRRDVEVDVHLRAHVLADLAHDRDDAVGMRLSHDRRILHVLGPDPQNHRAPLVGRQTRMPVEHRRLEAHAVGAERGPERAVRALETGDDEVHRG